MQRTAVDQRRAAVRVRAGQQPDTTIRLNDIEIGGTTVGNRAGDRASRGPGQNQIQIRTGRISNRASQRHTTVGRHQRAVTGQHNHAIDDVVTGLVDEASCAIAEQEADVGTERYVVGQTNRADIDGVGRDDLFRANTKRIIVGGDRFTIQNIQCVTEGVVTGEYHRAIIDNAHRPGTG